MTTRTVNVLAAIVLTSAMAHADDHDERAATTLIAKGASVRRSNDGRVYSLTLLPGPSRVTDADLACLDGLDGLRSVMLCETRLTDAGLAHLATLPALERVYLGGDHTDAEGKTSVGGTGLTDAGLAHLAKIKTLRHLVLAAPKFTDAGLAHIEGMTELTELGLSSPGSPTWASPGSTSWTRSRA